MTAGTKREGRGEGVRVADRDPQSRGQVQHIGATRGVTVSMFAFLACHQCCCAGSGLAWDLNLRAVVCGIF